MIKLTDEQQQAIDKCYQILKDVGLDHLEVGCPIPPKGV